MSMRIIHTTRAVLLATLVITSCYTYREVLMFRKYSVPGVEKRGEYPGEIAAAGDEEKDGKFIRAGAVRYLALICPPSPVAAINNRGVMLAAEGYHGAAGILFREAASEDRSSAAAINNSAVIYEITGRREDAFRMYTTACMLDPYNRRFRDNFNGFADYREERHRGRSADIPLEKIEEPARRPLP